MNYNEISSLFLDIKDYKAITEFKNDYNSPTYLEFDNYSSEKLNLFTVHENFDFALLEETINNIIETMPSIKRIFAKPIIHLVDQDNILPVEAVKKINNDTMNHISFHSELWSNVNEKEIQPRKLLTRNNIDNYSIYENIAFAHLINIILSFSRKYLRFLKDFIYTSKSLNFNYLDRINHVKYYLSLGKLHTGYLRNYESNYEVIDRCINKLNFIYTIVSARLNRPVYKINAKKDRNGFVLKKTNILKMHKDYHKIYLLLKSLSINNIVTLGSASEDNLNDYQNDYFNFVELLSLFSIINFNFSCKNNDLFDFDNLDNSFKAKDFTLRLTKESIFDINYLKFSFNKSKEYSLIIIPCSNPENFNDYLKIVKENIDANEYVIATLIENVKDTVYLAINNIDSFRRIEQLILKGMISSDLKYNYCPFCLSKLTKVEGNNLKYECGTCRNVIETIKCNNCNNEYQATAIKGYKNYIDLNKRITENNGWLLNRNLESLMYFRNITKIDGDMNFICPKCNTIHKI